LVTVDEDDAFDEADLDANYVESKRGKLARREGFDASRLAVFGCSPPTLRFEDRPKRKK
jgi:hypothetical protein